MNSTSKAMYIAEDPELDEHIDRWFRWDKNEVTKSELQNLIASNDVQELRTRLTKRLKFGTAGIRAQMGAGFSCINDLTIIQTTQGLLRYLQHEFKDLRERGVVIGYDGRHNSLRFSWLTANIFIKESVPVYWYSRANPTPFVAFAVKPYNCVCGIMITASHNPKKDNGYKVYWSNGAQVVSPIDKHIAEFIEQNQAPWCTSWDLSGIEAHHLKTDPLPEMLEKYYSSLLKLSFCKMSTIQPHDYIIDQQREVVASSPVRFAYTAMHGVGYYYIVQAMAAWGFAPPVPVNEQVEPDPDFPTVKYPNPEEGEGALAMAIATAERETCPIILANDPDVDRFVVAEIQPSGEWKIFSGNEMGALFGWWLWHNYKLNTPNAKGEDVYMLASTVSSKILRSMANKEGFNFIETLTGFKWMASEADRLLKQGKTVLFAFEEAIGYMVGSTVLDKDGISALCCMAEIACFLYDQGSTLADKLEDIYNEYGYHTSLNSYYICHKPETINTIFREIRNCKTSNKYPHSVGSYPVKNVRDLTVGYDSSTMDELPVLPVDPASQMITLVFENGCEVTLRTSGTEPKIKYYSEMVLSHKSELTRDEADKLRDSVVNAVITDLLKPDKYSLVPRDA